MTIYEEATLKALRTLGIDPNVKLTLSKAINFARYVSEANKDSDVIRLHNRVRDILNKNKPVMSARLSRSH